MRCKVTDFGMTRAKAIGQASEAAAAAACEVPHDAMTLAMTRCGTPYWTAPEIIQGDKYNESVSFLLYFFPSVRSFLVCHFLSCCRLLRYRSIFLLLACACSKLSPVFLRGRLKLRLSAAPTMPLSKRRVEISHLYKCHQ